MASYFSKPWLGILVRNRNKVFMKLGDGNNYKLEKEIPKNGPHEKITSDKNKKSERICHSEQKLFPILLTHKRSVSRKYK
jgi:hypothetical protein